MARRSQEAGLTQPRAHLLADSCTHRIHKSMKLTSLGTPILSETRIFTQPCPGCRCQLTFLLCLSLSLNLHSNNQLDPSQQVCRLQGEKEKKATVLMQVPSYRTETVLTNKITRNRIQGSAKRLTLGCVNPTSWLPLAAGHFTQPRAHLSADPCRMAFHV